MMAEGSVRSRRSDTSATYSVSVLPWGCCTLSTARTANHRRRSGTSASWCSFVIFTKGWDAPRRAFTSMQSAFSSKSFGAPEGPVQVVRAGFGPKLAIRSFRTSISPIRPFCASSDRTSSFPPRNRWCQRKVRPMARSSASASVSASSPAAITSRHRVSNNSIWALSFRRM